MTVLESATNDQVVHELLSRSAPSFMILGVTLGTTGQDGIAIYVPTSTIGVGHARDILNHAKERIESGQASALTTNP